MVQENPRTTTRSRKFLQRMRAQLPKNLQGWLASLAALVVILGFILSFFRNDVRSPEKWEDMSVRAFGDNVRNDVQDLTASLAATTGSLFDISVLQSRQRLELLTDQVETVVRRWADENIRSVDNAEHEFLRVLKNELKYLTGSNSPEVTSEVAEMTPDVVDAALADVSVALDSLSTVRAYPIVLGYTPLFVPAGGDGDHVRIEVAGSFLTSGDPHLTIGNVGDDGCERSRASGDTGLVFLCDGNLFPTDVAKGFQTGTLRVYREPGFFDGLFGYEPAEYLYSFSFRVVPDDMGQAQLSVATQRTTSERQYKSQSFSYRNGHCQGTSHQLFSFNASDGWMIEPSSIEATCDRSSRSSCNGLRDITDRSFRYSCTVANNGTCGPFWRDGRGSCWGDVKWTEVRNDQQTDVNEIKAVLRWGREKRIELPEGTRSVQISVDKADGNRPTFETSVFSDPWFEGNVYLEDRYVVIKPVELDIAMRSVSSDTE